MVDLRYLQVFCKVAELGSFTQAARTLHLPKSRVSRYIGLLEAEFSQELLYRTTRQIELTAFGKKIYRDCSSGFQMIEQGVKSFEQDLEEASGVIRVTAPEDFSQLLLAKIVAQFSILNPKVRIDIISTEQVLDLVKDSIDVAIRVGKPKHQSLKARRIGYAEFVLVTSPKYAHRFPKNMSIADLAQADLVTFGPRDGDEYLNLTNGSESAQVKSKVRIGSRSMMMMMEVIIAGGGIGVLPRFVALPALRNNQLIEICKGWAPKKKPLYLVRPPQHNLSSVVKRFIEYAVLHLESGLRE